MTRWSVNIFSADANTGVKFDSLEECALYLLQWAKEEANQPHHEGLMVQIKPYYPRMVEEE